MSTTKPREVVTAARAQGASDRSQEPEFKPDWRYQEPVAWRDTDLNEKTLKEWFNYILLGRQVDYRFQVLNRQGRAPFIISCAGHEAAQIGVGWSLKPKHDWLANTGGSIGIALPLAVGVAVACPDRRVLCLSADGSGMSTLQALWTLAREGLNVTTVIFANHAYAVLQREFSGLGVGKPGPRAADLLEIGRPDIDWVSLAKGMGVPGTRAVSLEGFAKALREGFEADGPTLIEVGV